MRFCEETTEFLFFALLLVSAILLGYQSQRMIDMMTVVVVGVNLIDNRKICPITLSKNSKKAISLLTDIYRNQLKVSPQTNQLAKSLRASIRNHSTSVLQ